MMSLAGRRLTGQVCGNVIPWEENQQAAAPQPVATVSAAGRIHPISQVCHCK